MIGACKGTSLTTQICRITDGGGEGHPTPDNFFDPKLTPTNYTSLIGKGNFISDNENILISRVDEQFSRNAPQ